MSHKPTGPSDYYKRKLARTLWKTKRRIWRDVSKKIYKPRKNKVEVNLFKINKKAKNGDVIVVPGKILSMGSLDHTVIIACLNASKSARQNVKNSSTESKIISIEELLDTNPSGSNVKIIV